MKTKKNKRANEFDIEAHTVACDISYRGGTLNVDVSSLFEIGEDNGQAIMGAYQNYLGGGMAGSICGGSMFDPSKLSKKDQATFEVLSARIKLHFYELNNGGGDEYMQENVTGKDARNGYLKNQSLPRTYPGL